ncbi:MAG: hypothetical protein JKY08_04530 [Flavobacteriaceae bacterium]|nr:hypothetical protein [Flavobacteriaceae bacterium]
MKYTLIFLFTFIYSMHAMAQFDDNKKAYKSLNLKAKVTKFKTKPRGNYTLESKNKKNIVTLNNTAIRVLKSKKTTQSAVMIPALEKGVYVKKIFAGQDLTFGKKHSTSELGTITTKGKEIVIECRDHSLVDGDIISVYVNDQIFRENIILKNNYFVIDVALKMGYNKITFLAKNQGYSGPNTAQFVVYDSKGNLIFKQGWNINTGQTATFGVIRAQLKKRRIKTVFNCFNPSFNS